jgi:hypothetical protein
MRRVLLLTFVLVTAVHAMAGTGRIVIVNSDAAGQGFNDPTPATPVGGNQGTTRGQQRMNVFLAAAEHWRKVIDTNVDIIADAKFPVIPGCTAEEAILGQAAPQAWRDGFPNAPKANTWYPIALANKFAGVDLEPTQPDIFVQFNSGLDNATCLGATDWYYGLDGEAGNDVDLYMVVLHELGHGLGVSGAFGDPDFRAGKPSVFDTHVLDRTLGLRWDQMTRAQRQVSMTNTGNLVWDGEKSRDAAARVLDLATTLTISEPAEVAGNYDVGRADFGGDATQITGRIVQATDAADETGPSASDGCTAFTNADAVSGNVALIDRGSCTFVVKARNAQAAGATAVIIGDRSASYNAQNPPTCLPPGMHGEDADDVTVPIISIGINDATRLKAQFAGEVVMRGLMRTDPSQRAGTSPEGYVRLYAPCTLQQGSSVHHWDVVATPNLLMEPSINSDLLHDVDLTMYMLIDMGWTTRTGRRFLQRPK